MEFSWLELVGWVADAFFLCAYWLVSTKRVKGESKAFNSMNLVGAILYGIYATFKNALPIVVLEFFWGGIASIALYKAFFRPEEVIDLNELTFQELKRYVESLSRKLDEA